MCVRRAWHGVGTANNSTHEARIFLPLSPSLSRPGTIIFVHSRSVRSADRGSRRKISPATPESNCGSLVPDAHRTTTVPLMRQPDTQNRGTNI
ncbi:hypothetical protein FRACA_1420016 [Frankia canadensis]|uniref:Uncharacterized protein n=1 Tax=Frankia canadensis TaxID=1836972 RepID=A0A2I2KLH7_9ACTN|nr:hypothetical protein FRACA_1420016 [Frankia canadensis]SOU53805.1 hypothetical protein FRACA_1420016 [Frankia canadensis]